MPLKLITVPNPLLRTKSKPIDKFDQKTFHFITELGQTLIKTKNPPGVGLSAIQVGRPLRVFVTYLPPVFDIVNVDDSQPPQQLQTFINPEIIDHSDNQIMGADPKHPNLEGCLSVPGLYGPVPRWEWVRVKYQTLSTKDQGLITRDQKYSNFFARVIQHEYDHLEGKLFTDYTLTANQKLYFDEGDQLVHVQAPKQLITW